MSEGLKELEGFRVKAVGIGLIGCGNISDAYLKAAEQFPVVEIVACADINPIAAQDKADRYDIEAMDIDCLLSEARIDVVLNLTTPQFHVEVGAKALRAGKHTYSEKPLAISLTEAATLIALAKDRGLRVGCAPDTFMGGAHQTARRAVDNELIGRPVAGTAFMMCPGHESWHPNPDFYYKAGGGPLMDMGPYYLTALINLLGPVKTVSGTASTSHDTRIIGSGERKDEIVNVEVPTHISAILSFVNGAIVTLTTSFDVPKHGHSPIEIYGTAGSMLVSDPNKFDGDIKVANKDEDWEILVQEHLYGDGNYRILGLVDMAQAIVSGRPHRASLELSLHVLEVMECILRSSEQEQVIHLKHLCERPAPMRPDLPFGQLD